MLNKDSIDTKYNWNYLKNVKNVELVKGDIRNLDELKQAAKDVDTFIHTAAQTAITLQLLTRKHILRLMPWVLSICWKLRGQMMLKRLSIAQQINSIVAM